MPGKNSSFRQEGNVLIYTRMLSAPRDLVWEVWTDPQHIENWWGPDGYFITNKSMEVKTGSEWRFTMFGHGMVYENKIVYQEVIKPSLLVYRHGDDKDTMGFTVMVSFEEVGERTMLTMRSIFESEEIIAELDRKVNAIASGQQTLNKLEAYLEKIQ